ncbi:MAG: polyamine aminopropyltransferase [Alphaproteobacteria bacterium]|nr:polyamine aminopropyltransferase [Alphaproteobacteria bacterium]
MQLLLLLSVFVIATCGLVYELIAGTLASYLLGDSVTQFSTIIGTYLFAMGIGSWLSRYITRNLLAVFVQIEVLVGIVGGCSAAMLFLLFPHVQEFRVLLYGTVLVTGTLVGVEIPLLLRILKDKLEFSDLVSRVFTFDYIGALFASLLFPLILVPQLGLIRSAFLFGLLNVAVAIWLLAMLKQDIPWVRLHRGGAIAAFIALLMGFVYSDRIMEISESGQYPDSVIFSRSSPYQRLVLTKSGNDLRLFLNNNLQFSSRDEYRYHESLVHPAMASLDAPKRVLVLGGGDGLGVREILKYPSVEEVTLVDLDPLMTELFSTHALLREINRRSLHSPKVNIVHADAFQWLRARGSDAAKFDFIMVDFPDPATFSLGKLYSSAFYRLLSNALAENGQAAIQSTSPFAARQSYWCIVETIKSAGLEATPYHALVPSFGEWGFVIAGHRPFTPAARYPDGLAFVNRETFSNMLSFPPDMGPMPAPVNTLHNQALVRSFEAEWGEYLHN